ncbi:conserved hypothetical protein [Salmonella enterica subsp. enterica serovar Paratyphi A]|nr:conserved hypothetical protein [Salmonella enterica subsp. enterica serovar Paratyphi A]
MICPRCADAHIELMATSPVKGVWTVYQCQHCLYTWRDTEPLRRTSREHYPQAFRMTQKEAYIFQCRSFISQQTETARQHFTLFGVQFEQPFDDALFHIVILRGVFRTVLFFIGQDVQQRFFGITAQRSVYRGNALVETKHTADVINRFIQLLCNFFRTRFVVQFMRQLTCGAQVYVQLFNNVNRQANRTGLVHNRPFDCLANPPGCVC